MESVTKIGVKVPNLGDDVDERIDQYVWSDDSPPTADALLRKGAATYADRNKTYGGNYKRFGPIMAEMFPDGLTIKTSQDWGRMLLLVQMISKLTRFCNSGLQHADSVHDLMVYSAMLEELLLTDKEKEQ